MKNSKGFYLPNKKQVSEFRSKTDLYDFAVTVMKKVHGTKPLKRIVSKSNILIYDPPTEAEATQVLNSVFNGTKEETDQIINNIIDEKFTIFKLQKPPSVFISMPTWYLLLCFSGFIGSGVLFFYFYNIWDAFLNDTNGKLINIAICLPLFCGNILFFGWIKDGMGKKCTFYRIRNQYFLTSLYFILYWLTQILSFFWPTKINDN